MYSPAALSELLLRPRLATDDLIPFIDEVLRQDPAVPTAPVDAPEPPDGPPPADAVALGGMIGTIGSLFGPVSRLVGTFSDPAWHLYRRMWGVRYAERGRFFGRPVAVETRGGRDYVYRPDPHDPFGFVRANGRAYVPKGMVTDGGSVPRVCWAVPGLDPWTHLPSFILHDDLFVRHHCEAGFDCTFEEANDVLAEAMYTAMLDGNVPEDWRVLAAVHVAVSSFVGRKVWAAPWTPDQCALCTTV